MPHRRRKSRKHGTNPDLLARLEAALWLPAGTDEADRCARIEAARTLLREVAPEDGTEAMLACQMVATHEAALECLRRSSAPDITEELRDQNLKHAERLLSIYARQMEVLGRYRLRGQQLTERRDKVEGRKPRFHTIRRIIVDPSEGTEVESPPNRLDAQPAAAEKAAPESPPPNPRTSARANGRRSYIVEGGI